MVDYSLGWISFTLFTLFTAIFILWISTNLMVKVKKIVILLPFFFSGILFLLNATFSFYEIYDQKIWAIFEFLPAILFLWIFVNLWRKNAFN